MQFARGVSEFTATTANSKDSAKLRDLTALHISTFISKGTLSFQTQNYKLQLKSRCRGRWKGVQIEDTNSYVRLCCARNIILSHVNRDLIYFYIKLDKTQCVNGSFIVLVERGGA
jgi:hypothetical protein